MSAFLDKSGLTHLWGKITSYINSKIADVSTLYGTATVTVDSSGSVECNIDPDTFVDAIRAGKRAVVTLATTTDDEPLVFATWFSSGDYFADAVVLDTTNQAYTLKVHRLFATKSGGGSWRYVTYTTNAMRDSNASGADGTVPVFSAENNRWEPELLTPLIGSTSSITPAQVAEAVEGGRLVVLTDDAEGATGTKVAQWAVAGNGSMVQGLCSWDIVQGDADRVGQVMLTELVGYLDDRGWVHSRLEGAILPQVDASDSNKVLVSQGGVWLVGAAPTFSLSWSRDVICDTSDSIASSSYGFSSDVVAGDVVLVKFTRENGKTTTNVLSILSTGNDTVLECRPNNNQGATIYSVCTLNGGMLQVGSWYCEHEYTGNLAQNLVTRLQVIRIRANVTQSNVIPSVEGVQF